MKKLLLSALLAAFLHPAPSFAQLEYIVSPTVPKKFVVRTKKAIDRVERYFKREWGYQLNVPVKVILSDSEAFLKPYGGGRSNGNECYGGFARPRQLVLCTEVDGFKRSSFDVIEIQKGITAHEFAHLVQFEVTRGNMRPAWMIEGFAEFVFFDLIPNSTRIDRTKTIQNWKKTVRNVGPLQSLEGFDAVNTVENAYTKSFLAVRDLEKQHGMDAIRSYFELLGRGMRWQTAFEQSFNQSPAAFYNAFE